MKVRALSATGDMTFGNGRANFLVNSSAAVEQKISTRLNLKKGDWFLDLTAGTDMSQVIGFGTDSTRDVIIQNRISQTIGVTEIVSYSSTVLNRGFSVQGQVQTQYSLETVAVMETL